MTRLELFTKLENDFPYLSKSQIEMAVRRIFEELTATMERGDRVELRGFGTFSTRSRRDRIGHNPRSGEPVAVDAKTVPFFRASKTLLERMNAEVQKRNDRV